MKTVRIAYIVICISLLLTLVLSLFLTLAQNNDLVLLKSNGLGLLGLNKDVTDDYNGRQVTGREDFFGNPYGFKTRNSSGILVDDNSMIGFGITVRIIYWIFFISCIAIILCLLLSMFFNNVGGKIFMPFVFAEIILGFFVSGIGIACVTIARSLFSFTYTTQYYFLAVPLTVAFVSTVIASIMIYRKNKKCKKCGKKLLKDMLICGYCGEIQ